MLFYRWHPQLYLRYTPIVNYIKKLKLDNPSILEVGSGPLGIGPYLNQSFMGIDVDFSGPQWPAMKRIIASAKKLPFADHSFDIVICVDTLEHITPRLRQRVIAELLQVTKSHLILAFPSGGPASQQDKNMHELYFRRFFGQQFPFLQEHIKYGLPDAGQVYRWLKPFGHVETTTGHNLKLRAWLMNGWITKNLLVDIFFRKVLLLFLPILKIIDQKPPHYRTYFFAKI